jgi:hypothetical protein
LIRLCSVASVLIDVPVSPSGKIPGHYLIYVTTAFLSLSLSLKILSCSPVFLTILAILYGSERVLKLPKGNKLQLEQIGTLLLN